MVSNKPRADSQRQVGSGRCQLFVELLLECGQAWEGGLQGFRQVFAQPVFGNADGFLHVAEGVLGYHAVAAFAEQETCSTPQKLDS